MPISFRRRIKPPYIFLQIKLSDGDCLFLPITPEVDDPEENPLLPAKDVTVDLKEEISSELNSEEKTVKTVAKRKKSVKTKNNKIKKRTVWVEILHQFLFFVYISVKK